MDEERGDLPGSNEPEEDENLARSGGEEVEVRKVDTQPPKSAGHEMFWKAFRKGSSSLRSRVKDALRKGAQTTSPSSPTCGMD